jgi:hypothetical protein
VEIGVDLRCGITGFRDIDDPPLPSSNFVDFRSHCYSVARVLNCSVVAVEAPILGVACNFVSGTFKFSRDSVAVLLNAHFPVVAFSEPLMAGTTHLRFIDSPKLADAFQNFGLYEVPDFSELTAPLTLANYDDLAADERKQIKYWKPQSVGEVVFNFWD